MPIEFRCPSCSKLLRTPDESAGKKAKCPQCGGIADVPLTSSPAAGGAGMPSGVGTPLAPLPPTMPTGAGSGIPPGKSPFAPFDSTATNPYASPAPAFSTPVAGLSQVALVPTRISFDRFFESVWSVYKPQMGTLAVFGLVIMGINIGLQIIGQGGTAAVQATGVPALMVGFTALNTLFGMVVQAWLNLGSAIYMLKAARNQQPSINDLGAAGPFFVRAILMQLVIILITSAILSVCLAPAAILYFVMRDQQSAGIAAAIGVLVAVLPMLYIFYSWLVALFFIVDRNLGVMESLSQSKRFMSGNRLIAFLILLVVGFVGGILGLMTCCIGFIWIIPYISLVNASIYLSVTGQSFGPTAMNRMA